MVRARRAKRRSLLDCVTEFGFNPDYASDIKKFLSGEEIKYPDVKQMVRTLLASRSKVEKNWRLVCPAKLEEKYSSPVIYCGYEHISFKVPGGVYTPDFDCLLADGRWIFVEVKASKHQQGYRDARSKLRASASLNPWFTFVEVRPESKDWAIEDIKPDGDILDRLILIEDILTEENDGRDTDD